MAKTILDCAVVTRATAAGQRNVARCTVEMPITELAAFLVLAGLTNAVPTKDSNFALAAGDTAAPQ